MVHHRIALSLLLAASFSVAGCVAPSAGSDPPASFPDRKELWSIGLARGRTPLTLEERVAPPNPVVTWRTLHRTDAAFVADPFLEFASGRWHLFFELYNNKTQRGEIGLATSEDLQGWKFERVVLKEPFHLSYPFVFEHENSYFMIPESRAAGSIRLYRATQFPSRWVFDQVLIEGAYSDASLVFFEGRWWIFAARSPYDLMIFYADSIRGPWREHAMNPVYTADPSKARPGGRPVVVDGALIRFVQDNREGYGRKVRAMVVDQLSPTVFREHPAEPDSVFGPKGIHWARNGMHHIAPSRAPDGTWIAAIDGNGDGLSE